MLARATPEGDAAVRDTHARVVVQYCGRESIVSSLFGQANEGAREVERKRFELGSLPECLLESMAVRDVVDEDDE